GGPGRGPDRGGGGAGPGGGAGGPGRAGGAVGAGRGAGGPRALGGVGAGGGGARRLLRGQCRGGLGPEIRGRRRAELGGGPRGSGGRGAVLACRRRQRRRGPHRPRGGRGRPGAHHGLVHHGVARVLLADQPVEQLLGGGPVGRVLVQRRLDQLPERGVQPFQVRRHRGDLVQHRGDRGRIER